jgi:endonuclease VIII
MPEGDTIHRIADRMRVALAGKTIERAEAPSPRSPLHTRASELRGRTLDDVEARGKHLIAHFSGDVAIHNHLGMNGRWFIRADGRISYGKPWLVLASGRAVASLVGGKTLRLVSESRLRNDPGLAQLGPDPLAPDFDREDAAGRLLRAGAATTVGEALLDQSLIAGVGNVIRIEACFRARISPWRPIGELEPDEAVRLIAECERVMRATLRTGRRPSTMYKPAGRVCPRCGGRVQSMGQGDANRATYWCEHCQV